MTHVAVYCRISRDSEGRSEGVAAQEKKATALAADLWPGLPVVAYVDNDISAATPGTVRPSYLAMIEATRAGQVEQVVAAEQSRLTRQPAEWEELSVVLARAGIAKVHTYRSGPIDVMGSRMLGRILAAVDAEEVERTRARVLDKMANLAAEGRPPGGRGFGYRSGVAADGRKTLEIVPEEAEAARDAVAKLLAGWSLKSIALEFEQRGVPTARGGQWRSQNVRSLLLSPTLAGLRVHHGEVVGRGTWEPIIDEATWRRVVAVLTAPHPVIGTDGATYMVTRNRQPARRYLLTGGIARCGRCGTQLTAQTRSGKTVTRNPIYTCHKSRGGCSGIGIGADPLEQHVVAMLLAELDKPEFLEHLAGDDHGAERDHIMADLAAIDDRRRELAEAWGADRLSTAEWEAARGGLESRAAQLNADLAMLAPGNPTDIDVSTVIEGWDAMTLEERRQVIRMFIDTVTVGPAVPGRRTFDPDRVTIEWR